jgi:hypothetical protein
VPSPDKPSMPGLCAKLHGFSLHAAVRWGADQRQQLEHLCRYITRPAIANQTTVRPNRSSKPFLQPVRQLSVIEEIHRNEIHEHRLHPSNSTVVTPQTRLKMFFVTWLTASLRRNDLSIGSCKVPGSAPGRSALNSQYLRCQDIFVRFPLALWSIFYHPKAPAFI